MNQGTSLIRYSSYIISAPLYWWKDMLLNVNYKIFDINVYYEVTASNPSSVVTKKNSIYVSIIINSHVGTVVRISRKEYQTSISISYKPVSLLYIYRPSARWAHGLLWWPRTAITNVVFCLVKRLSLFLYCLSEIKFTTTTYITISEIIEFCRQW